MRSNNDGCGISRSEEAKALGVPMGAPCFRVRALCESRGVAVFAATGRHGAEPHHAESATLNLPAATNLTTELIAQARRGAERIYREGLRFKKAGVTLYGLVDAPTAQREFFGAVDRVRMGRVMSAVDAVNARMGVEALRFAASGFRRGWRMLCERRSPRYTTRWDELLGL